MRAGRVFRRLCDAYDALFIVNDRPELAIACAADGVHLGQDDADPREVRRLVGARRADRALDPLARAGRRGRRGRLHRGRARCTRRRRSPTTRRSGSTLVRYAAEHATVPFFAIGGIDAGNVGEVRRRRRRAGRGRAGDPRRRRSGARPRARCASAIEARLHAGAR